MGPRRTLGCLLGALVAWGNPGYAAAAIGPDQSYDYYDYLTRYAPYSPDDVGVGGVAQTFTAGSPGHLIGVYLLMNHIQGTVGLNVEIRAGTPTGALLATSNTVSAGDVPGDWDLNWVAFNFASPALIVQGETYAIVLPEGPPTLDPTAYNWAMDRYGTYSGGVAWWKSIPDWQALTACIGPDGCDQAFRTWVQVGPSPFWDAWYSPFLEDIEWLYDSGITTGCEPVNFCPWTPVTREQMASFLVRALGLPATGIDFFTDDEASIHEADINRLAASGITAGCSPTQFCPGAAVTREQMASFLVRGLGLPATGTDFFTDDEDSMHEADINRLAASGITSGCSPTQFCPRQEVTREQMAAFLHRAIPASAADTSGSR